MNEMKEAVGNWREAKQFSPADENDFLRWTRPTPRKSSFPG